LVGKAILRSLLRTTLPRFTNFWLIPSTKEISKLEADIDRIKKEIDTDSFYTSPEKLGENNQKVLVCATLPVLQFGDVEEISKEKGRLVNIQNSLNFKQSPIFDYLSYFSALQKFFELEFFMNKVGSVSESVAGLELHCLSGLQFWEDSDESLLLGMDQ